MSDLYFKFSEPQHGWMDVGIYDEGMEVEMTISDVPCNSIQKLADILLGLQAGSSYEEVAFSLEPDFALWKFFVIDGDSRLEVFSGPARETPIVFKLNKNKAVKRLYKALRDLESLSIWRDPELSGLAWSWDFPSIELNTFKLNASK